MSKRLYSNSWSWRMSTPSSLAAMVLVTFLGGTAETGATLIATYRSSDEVIIAADSLRTVKTAPPVQIHACKIRNFGDVVFAAAGDSTLPGQGFSIKTISGTLHERNRIGAAALRDQITIFDQRTIAAFKKLHKQRQKTRPVTFTYIVAFVLKGRPVAYLREHLRARKGPWKLGDWRRSPRTTLSSQDSPRSLTTFPVSAGPMIRHQPRYLKRSLSTKHDVARPNKVGGPVDIIRLTETGVMWLQRKPECPERE